MKFTCLLVSSYATRNHQRLTLDVIMSSAFGVKSDCQTNPDDPAIAKVTKAMSTGLIQKIVFALVFMLPFKKLLFNSKWVSNMLFSNWSLVNSLAREMIEVKRKGGVLGRKVKHCLNKIIIIVIIASRFHLLLHCCYCPGPSAVPSHF